MDLWSIKIIVEDKFKELFSEYFENFDGYLSSGLFQDKDLNSKSNSCKYYCLTNNKLGLIFLLKGQFHSLYLFFLMYCEVNYSTSNSKSVGLTQSESNNSPFIYLL